MHHTTHPFHPQVKKNMHTRLALVNMLVITNKFLDSSSQRVIYRSAVQPTDDIHPNKHLLTDIEKPVGSNKPKPITFVKSHQNLDKSVSKPMAEYNPDDLIDRAFLLPPNQKGE